MTLRPTRPARWTSSGSSTPSGRRSCRPAPRWSTARTGRCCGSATRPRARSACSATAGSSRLPARARKLGRARTLGRRRARKLGRRRPAVAAYPGRDMDSPPERLALAELRTQLDELTPKDQRRLRRRLDGAARIRGVGARRSALDRIAADIAAARQRIESRRARIPRIRYPDELPVSQRKDDLLEVIGAHQVVIVAGETGSGKTTQLPKICLELGRGVRGMIGHTQPRRLAARAVADRIAEELGSTLGDLVGYQVRFTAQVGDHSLVKVMTDGILLAELAQDRMLSRYDTLT